MISELIPFEQVSDTWDADKVYSQELRVAVFELDLRPRMINTLWLLATRYLIRLDQSDQLSTGQTVGVIADAVTSREAKKNKSHDGGREVFFRDCKDLFGGILNTACDSLEKADRLFEQLGLIHKERNGRGLVANISVNIRKLALFIETFHLDWEEIPKLFRWLKPVCDKLLGRPFRRLDHERGHYVDIEDSEYLSPQFEQAYPLKKVDRPNTPATLIKSFIRFCWKKIKELTVVIHDESAIANQPDDLDPEYEAYKIRELERFDRLALSEFNF